VEQLETRAVPAIISAADFASIQAAIDAAAANPGADEVRINPGTYFENLVINDASGALTLRGMGTTPAAVTINGAGATGIHAVLHNHVKIRNLQVTGSSDGIVAQGTAAPADLGLVAAQAVSNSGRGLAVTGGGTIFVVSSTFTGNGSTGADIVGASAVFVSSSTLSGNGSDGLSAVNVAGVVSLTQVTAGSNSLRGVNVREVGSFIDLLGNHSENISHGVLLFDVAGDVTMLGTRALGNDPDRDNTGAGVRLNDGPDADVLAVGGKVTVAYAQLNGNRTGFYSSGRIAGNVTFLGVSANDNQLDGLRFQDLTAGTQSIAGQLTLICVTTSGNDRHGVFVENAVAGDIYLVNVTASDNGFSTAPGEPPGSGVIINGAGNVYIWGGTFNNNEADGIHIEGALAVEVKCVVAEGNGDDDLEVISSGIPLIEGGSIINVEIIP
jgi:hypothetical protein